MFENKMEKFANLLGLEIGEEFKIRNKSRVMPEIYWCTDKEVLSGREHLGGVEYIMNEDTLFKLLNGTYEVVKFPWKPKYNYKYWTVTYNIFEKKFEVTSRHWCDSFEDIKNYRLGFCFKTEEEAERKLYTAEEFYNGKDLVDWSK